MYVFIKYHTDLPWLKFIHSLIILDSSIRFIAACFHLNLGDESENLLTYVVKIDETDPNFILPSSYLHRCPVYKTFKST